MFEEVDTEPIAPADDVVGAHAVLTQELQAGITYFVRRQAGDEVRRQTEVGDRNSHIRLTASIDDIKATGLREPQIVRRR
jgi:hypothetical protein